MKPRLGEFSETYIAEIKSAIRNLPEDQFAVLSDLWDARANGKSEVVAMIAAIHVDLPLRLRNMTRAEIIVILK